MRELAAAPYHGAQPIFGLDYGEISARVVKLLRVGVVCACVFACLLCCAVRGCFGYVRSLHGRGNSRERKRRH